MCFLPPGETAGKAGEVPCGKKAPESGGLWFQGMKSLALRQLQYTCAEKRGFDRIDELE